MPTERPWQIGDSALTDGESAPPEVVVLPTGATEPHGRHLPYATDNFQVEALADQAAGEAWRRGARVGVLPVIPFGVQTTQQAFPLAMNLRPTTLFRMLDDLAETLAGSGVRKAVLLNGHGGNDFYPWIKDSYGKHNVFFVQVHWFDVCRELIAQTFPAGGDHANDMETSLMLWLRPDLVRLDQAGPQPTATPRLRAMREGWAKAPRPWERYTVDSGAGDPRAATADKGRRLLEATTAKLADFLVELARAEIDEAFPFESTARDPTP
ncbi:creatininase family protein [Botrimarina hoheduenensis]|uniref:Creatinine amidohydrolase n=1 Tax=Botrimarina hoheduenensis TaxID=2528000 RepID=A0A5C5W9L7_9BACT|nr:creatininase family protein [Botrimarina hoheduenensis]TWT47566.1 Creatinine amidohydrolase [Botrimarina hoheduenensis]